MQSGHYNIAQSLYQGWLKSEGIYDPEARIQLSAHLGYVGVVGKQRRIETQRAYDILPKNLVVEINRAIDGIKPIDDGLVAKLRQASVDEHIQ